MKTAIIWQEIPERTNYYVLDGDLSRFDEKYVNLDDDDAELREFMFDEDGRYRQQEVTREAFRESLLDPTTKLIVSGMLM